MLNIGARLGDFANNVRSALNYTMRRFVTTRLQPALPRSEHRRLQRGSDFPWSDSRTGFDEKAVVAHARNHCEAVYSFLEGVQPYHQGKEWLGHLMRISNRDKHEIVEKIEDYRARALEFLEADGKPHPSPRFFGEGLDRILIQGHPEPRVCLCPCYYYPYGAFAAKGGRWVLFLIPVGAVHLGLTRFIETVPRHVRSIVDEFDRLMGDPR